VPGKPESLGEAALAPREATRALESLSTTISIVNPIISFTRKYNNGNVVMFLVDTRSIFSILQKDTWEKCKWPEQQLELCIFLENRKCRPCIHQKHDITIVILASEKEVIGLTIDIVATTQ